MKTAQILDLVKTVGPVDGRHILVISGGVVPYDEDMSEFGETLLRHLCAAAARTYEPGPTVADLCPMIVRVDSLDEVRLLDEDDMADLGWVRSEPRSA